MKIKFFTEGGKNIGYGHIIRCLSLAQAFKDSDYNCEFFISGDDSILNIIPDFKVSFKDWTSNPEFMYQNISPEDILIFDSYKAPQSLIDDNSKINKNLIFFDDYSRIDYPIGVLINGALNAESIYSKKNPNIEYLLGGKYQTLRKEFWNVDLIKKNNSINNVLITFGGDDSRNLTPQVIKILNEYNPGIKKNVIIGKSFSNLDSINNLMNENTKLIFAPSANQICELMKESDIAICGAGQTLYELARTKTPVLFIGIAENQKYNIQSWSDYPYFNFAGWWNRDNIIGRLRESFIKFDENFKQIAENIYSADLIIDGNGSKNIVEKILSYVRTK